MPRDPYAEAVQALEMGARYALDVKLSPVMCRALLERLTRDNGNQGAK